jgi:hypothetical protein
MASAAPSLRALKPQPSPLEAYIDLNCFRAMFLQGARLAPLAQSWEALYTVAASVADS